MSFSVPIMSFSDANVWNFLVRNYLLYIFVCWLLLYTKSYGWLLIEFATVDCCMFDVNVLAICPPPTILWLQECPSIQQAPSTTLICGWLLFGLLWLSQCLHDYSIRPAMYMNEPNSMQIIQIFCVGIEAEQSILSLLAPNMAQFNEESCQEEGCCNG